MTPRIRLTLLTILAVALRAAPAGADPINVAEFRWGCVDPLDVTCAASDPTDQSVFSLTGLWDYEATDAPTLSGFVTFDDGRVEPWLTLSPDVNYFDQFQIDGLALSAATTIFFEFLGTTRSLSTTLFAPGQALLSFDYEPSVTPPNPVPEPGTLGLLGIGLAVLSRSLARRRGPVPSPSR